MSWSARQYRLFEDERTRPVRDLLAALPPIEARSAVDIGCGPGNSTELLAARYPRAAIYGIDRSADMIAAAGRRLPKLRFEQGDLSAWHDPGPFDVLLANAVLHWLPNHAELLPALAAKLAPGGALAIQMPDNLDEPASRLMRELASLPPFTARLASAAAARTSLEDADWYYRLLRAQCRAVDVWRTTYHHPLAQGAAGIVEWFKGSGLRPFLDPLNDAEKNLYLERYTAAVTAAYPPMPDGSVLLPFPRLFIVAIR